MLDYFIVWMMPDVMSRDRRGICQNVQIFANLTHF